MISYIFVTHAPITCVKGQNQSTWWSYKNISLEPIQLLFESTVDCSLTVTLEWPVLIYYVRARQDIYSSLVKILALEHFTAHPLSNLPIPANILCLDYTTQRDLIQLLGQQGKWNNLKWKSCFWSLYCPGILFINKVSKYSYSKVIRCVAIHVLWKTFRSWLQRDECPEESLELRISVWWISHSTTRPIDTSMSTCLNWVHVKRLSSTNCTFDNPATLVWCSLGTDLKVTRTHWYIFIQLITCLMLLMLILYARLSCASLTSPVYNIYNNNLNKYSYLKSYFIGWFLQYRCSLFSKLRILAVCILGN